jgi:hypothetical protein
MNNILNLKYGLGANTAVPHVIARSNIFSSQIYRGPIHRSGIKIPCQIATLGGVKIVQTAGHRLDQGDANVFYEILGSLFSQLENRAFSSQVTIARSDLLSNIGRSKGGKTNALLHDSLIRLVNAEFLIDKNNSKQYTTGILQGFAYHSEGNSKYVLIEIDPRFLELYMNNEWVILKKKERDALSSPISKALHAYYCTHQKPYPLCPETLKRLADRTNMQESKWLIQLQSALDEIKLATGWHVCEISTSEKYAGKVTVVKKPADVDTKCKAALNQNSDLTHIEDDYGI